MQLKRVCPCCAGDGDFYDKDGVKQFKPVKIHDKLTIELCPRDSCVKGGARVHFVSDCLKHYMKLKDDNEVRFAAPPSAAIPSTTS